MIPVKVVLASADGEKELELGPFNQGVVMEPTKLLEPANLIDVATGESIARFLQEGVQRTGTTSIYSRAFIQPAPTRELAEEVYLALCGEDDFLRDITVDAIFAAMGGELKETEIKPEPTGRSIELVRKDRDEYKIVQGWWVGFNHVLSFNLDLPDDEGIYWHMSGDGFEESDLLALGANLGTRATFCWDGHMIVSRVGHSVEIRPLRKVD